MAVLSYFLGLLSAGWGWIDETSSNHRRPGMDRGGLLTSKDGKMEKGEMACISRVSAEENEGRGP